MIEIQNLKPFHPNVESHEVFEIDRFHMGKPLGLNVIILHPNHKTEPCPYFIIVNMETGERVRVNFSQTNKYKLAESVMNAPVDCIQCIGCEDNYYNGDNPHNIKECWSLKNARIVSRRKIPIDQKPPYDDIQPITVPSCYYQKGFVFYEV